MVSGQMCPQTQTARPRLGRVRSHRPCPPPRPRSGSYHTEPHLGPGRRR